MNGGPFREHKASLPTPEKANEYENNTLVSVFVVVRDGTASSLGAIRHSHEQTRSRLRGKPTFNTVSVIDPYTNKLLGVIKLGDPVPGP